MSCQQKLGLILEYPVALSQGTPMQCGQQKSQDLSQDRRSATVLLFPKEALSPQLLPIQMKLFWLKANNDPIEKLTHM